MVDLSPKNEPTLSEPDNTTNTEDLDDPENLNSITSHLYLRPIHSSQTLDKKAVLQRIRHRKRMNKVRNAVHGFFGWPVSAKTEKVSICQIKWVDDAFAAP